MKSEWGLSQTPFLQANPNKPGSKPKEESRKGKRQERKESREEGEDITAQLPPGKKRRDVFPEEAGEARAKRDLPQPEREAA